VYAYERRFLDGELRHAVVIDSKQSQLNRAEAALVLAIEDGHPVLGRVPQVVVTYQRNGTVERFSDLMLPHRVFDAHIRAGTVDGVPTTQVPAYRRVRDASPANARALLETSPVTLVFGGWDSHRASRQGRWRSALVGEIIGFCAERGPNPPKTAQRGGARVDPVGMQIQLGGAAMAAVARAQEGELSRKTFADIVKDAEKIKPGEVASASALGLGVFRRR
jgi:CRISPR-associated protein Csb1